MEIHYCSGQFPPKTKTFHSDGKGKKKKRAQINTGFSEKRILFAKELLLLSPLTHSLARSLHRWRDEGWKLRGGKMSFMRAVAHPISLSGGGGGRRRRRRISLLLCLAATCTRTHTHTVHLCRYTVYTHTCTPAFHPLSTKSLLFPLLRRLAFLPTSKGPAACGSTAAGRCTSPHCRVKFAHQWCVYPV